MSDKIRIAQVGIGGYGHYYLNELLNPPAGRNVQLVAGIDAFPERSRALSALQAAHIPIYPDLESFYRHDRADLVIVAAPIHLHAPFTCTALAHGAHVLCEKPLCALLSEADQMAEAEQQAGRFVAIGYQWSFSDAIQALKNDVLAGVLGRPRRLKTIVLWPRYRSYYHRNTWAGRIQTDDGQWVFDSPVSNATAHYLHNMLYLLGDSPRTSASPASLEAEVYRANPIENYDVAALRMITQHGAEILFYTAHAVRDQLDPCSIFEFENGVVEYGDDHRFVARFHDGRVKVYGDPDDTQTNKLWHSIDAMQTGASPLCGIQAARPHVLCVNAIQQGEIAGFPKELVHLDRQGDDALVWVDGLAETLSRCYQEGRLPSELGGIPWAVTPPRIQLADR